MILPIRRFGDAVLRKDAADIEADTPELQTLIDNMIETMHNAEGVGIAAPQVGEAIRLFVVDVHHLEEEYEKEHKTPFPDKWKAPIAFINPEILAESEDEIEFEEGCLSIPEIREMVVRPRAITIRFLDRHFQAQTWEVDKIMARVIQHEFDHIEGVLFIDHISAFKRRMLRRKLQEITKGTLIPSYPMAPVA